MRTSYLLALGLSSTILPALGSPASFDQIVLNGLRESSSKWDTVSSEFLSDAKQAILKGKKDMQKWYHDGKEFLKQNGLLCECLAFNASQIESIKPWLPDQMKSLRILPSRNTS
jgi:cathepsin A (carboxypeptidase C)